MVFLKPKDVAERLGVSPRQVSSLAKDLENAQLVQFQKTGLGSFLFREEDPELLLEYYQLLGFFGKKVFALQMFQEQMELKAPPADPKPEWSGLLQNAKYHAVRPT